MQGKMERIFLLCFTFVEPFIMCITEKNTQVHWSIVFSSASVKGTFIAFDFIVFTDAFRSMRFHGPKALSPWSHGARNPTISLPETHHFLPQP